LKGIFPVPRGIYKKELMDNLSKINGQIERITFTNEENAEEGTLLTRLSEGDVHKNMKIHFLSSSFQISLLSPVPFCFSSLFRDFLQVVGHHKTIKTQ
jgi:hypothetical protein